MSKLKGFTIVELLVVIAIIGLLSTLAVVSLNNARLKARDGKRVADIAQIQKALELYNNDMGGYPVKASPALVLGTKDTTDALINTAAGFVNGSTIPAGSTVYMGSVPANNPAGSTTPYSYISDGTTYTITFTLEGAVGSLQPGLRTASGTGIK